MKDIDIYRAAQATINVHGELAEVHAAQRADELMEQGDMDGGRVWQRIDDAIREMRRGRADGEVLN